ncbi:hypothetical protein CAPTEDRAFT_208507 [Capitella teleta]|uniref:Trichoplein keratin filament-binding protein n=1 Tax=Capitella teleta TaxID=283909 RepID=R7TZ35_CAPTE|nr:hypothetical protein CAPTEDRAFT_208507 [Capitella teleta]|eukprot:ELT99014.1 hypothetical protein CAPTEDRAFT_208507 [Capitella teleta]
MALPHLPTSYTTRKNIYEAALVTRRMKEVDFREKWDKNAQYFHRENVTAEVKKSWESNSFFQHSMDAMKANYEKETKAMNLKRRRLKLARLLRSEREALEAELKETQRGQTGHIEDIKERSEALRSAREEKRLKIAQQKLYEHWRVNSPDIRQLEEDQHRRHVKEEWSGQIDEHLQIAAKQKAMEEAYLREQEEERRLAEEREGAKEREKIEEEKRLQEILKNQVRHLKEKELEAKELKLREAALQREKLELLELEEQRRAIAEQRKKVEFGRVLLRQHAAALRRRSKQIQEELEQDRRFLEILAEQEERDIDVLTTRREKSRADATWMKQVIEDQIRLEKAREAELDILYQDEAAKIWDQREAEWQKERAARERLMQEVMNERQLQMDYKMEANRRDQEESLERREELIRDLDLANQLTRREEKRKEEEKMQRKKELEGQITTRREDLDDERLQLKLDLDEELKAENDYEQMLREEEQRLTSRGFIPKQHGRRQAWQ